MQRAGGLVCAAIVVVALALFAPGLQRPAGAVDRGIVDNRLEIETGVSPVEIPGFAAEIGRTQLHAEWTRVLVHWSRLQPVGPGVAYSADADGDGYSDEYVAELRSVLGELAANGVTAILTPTAVPRWASDVRLWSSPPSGDSQGYRRNYAMDVRDPVALGEFGRLGAFLAAESRTDRAYLECWNEPNTSGTFYPQSRPGDRWFAPRVYVEMLRAFHDAVAAADPSAVVIAGATAPRGADDVDSTTPRTFAAYLRAHGASRYFEAYSHHPYCWEAPHVLPRDRRAVWLANLDELTRLFPRKPFFLTEFGYGTDEPTLLGRKVSPATQARWLRNAFSYVRREHPQVKALLWFMVQDLAPNPDRLGAYLGLRTVEGACKPAWYAFAGGNAVTTVAPTSVAASTSFPLTGALTSRVAGGLAGKTVLLQTRAPSGRTWRRVASVRTESGGAFAFTTRQGRGDRLYRVIWNGVLEGRPVLVHSR